MGPDAPAQHSQEAQQPPWRGPESARSSTLAQCFLCGARAVLSCTSPCAVASTLSEVNHQPESRMRETRQSGSEGGGANPIVSPYPYSLHILQQNNFLNTCAAGVSERFAVERPGELVN